MIFENTSSFNFENAMRGARNPMNSWARMDSSYKENGEFVFGENDLNLAKRLIKAGSDHRKFIRQIFVSVDITAPLYWWKEYDTYKVGTVANSTSTMHKITSKPFDISDFTCNKMSGSTLEIMKDIIYRLELLRLSYIKNQNKNAWYSIIQLLPSSYNQTRTCTMNYENLRSMYHSRKNHKLDEWHMFCDWVKTLPYSEEFITDGE